MATKSSGVSGLAIGLATAGLILLYTGIKNVSVVGGLKDILKGQAPGTSGTQSSSEYDRTPPIYTGITPAQGENFNVPVPGSAESNSYLKTFVETAQRQIGKPYSFGAAGPDKFDCSGLVAYCLKAAGLDDKRRTAAGYLTWSGANSISRSQCSYGDLVCWTGHVGIALSNTQMIHAPQPGEKVKISNIWNTPAPTIRRIKLPSLYSSKPMTP